jgi:AraC family transcriptional regulator, regulatory protein of adaptative response / methylated-DNA-[protein]-cysteine methyltransferase
MNTHTPTHPPATGPVVGCRTTRIYCRPLCRPGRAPRRENCVPFPSAAAAREAGYRPCKQCRPDEDGGRGPSETIRYGVGPSPLGMAFVATTPRGICRLKMLDDVDPAPEIGRLRAAIAGAETVADPGAVGPILARVSAFLSDGDPCDDLPLDLRGTAFQRRVWTALRAIPRGQTRTYGEVADAVGVPGAARAVGAACGANTVMLLVPCHRVVGAGGSLGGFGAGLDRKRALLELEGAPVA